MKNFLMIDKNRLYGKDLQPIDILIIAQIEEFERSNECYVTNQQFATWFGVSVKTVERALDRLEELGYINRDTRTVVDNGQKSKQRKLSTGKGNVKMTQASKESNRQNVQKQTSICPEGNVNLSKSKRQNDAIKDNIKYNIKDNIKYNAHANAALDEAAPQNKNNTNSNKILAEAKILEIYKLKKWEDVIADIQKEFNLTYTKKQIFDLVNGDKSEQNKIQVEAEKITEQKKQDYLLKFKLAEADELVSDLADKGIYITKDEVVAACEEAFYNETNPRCRWSCHDIREVLKDKYTQFDGTFESVVKAHRAQAFYN